jgi:hypothetical protein
MSQPPTPAPPPQGGDTQAQPQQRRYGRPTDRSFLPAGGGVQPLIRLIALVCSIGIGITGWFIMRVPADEADLPPPNVRAAADPAAPIYPHLDAVRVRPAEEARILGHTAAPVGVYRFAYNRRVLVLVFPSLAEQGAALNRLAALVEKKGTPRDRVLDDDALAAAIEAAGATPATYYFGHDYAAADLARFFALATRDRIPLNPQERWLHDLLAREGLLAGNADGAIVAITRAVPEVDARLRTAILRHELAHGEYFTNASYAAHARRFWAESLDEPARNAFRRFLSARGYDTRDEDLLVNEMQAYLAFSPDPRLIAPDMLGMSRAEFERLQAAYLRDMPPGWLHDVFVPFGR